LVLLMSHQPHEPEEGYEDTQGRDGIRRARGPQSFAISPQCGDVEGHSEQRRRQPGIDRYPSYFQLAPRLLIAIRGIPTVVAPSSVIALAIVKADQSLEVS